MGLNDLLAKVTDPYERQARLYPALLAGLPIIVMVASLYGSNSVLTAASTIAVSCGMLYLLSSIAREQGKRLESSLYESWGGKPTTQLLRHRDHQIERPTKIRYHFLLSKMLNLNFPDEHEEKKDPLKADEVYQSAVRWLLGQTRDASKYRLIYQENIAYGFRRNSFGLRNIGIISCVCTSAWVFCSQGFLSGKMFPGAITSSTASVISLAVSVIMFFIWVYFFTESTVRSAAFTYAETLLRACDKIINDAFKEFHQPPTSQFQK